MSVMHKPIVGCQHWSRSDSSWSSLCPKREASSL